MRKLRNSLFFRLTVPCLVAVFALGVAYTFFWSTKYEGEVEARFIATGQASADLFAEAVAEALWEFDASSTRRILAGLEGTLGFEFAAVYDSGGQFASFLSGDKAPEVNLEQIQRTLPLQESGRLFFISKVVHPEHGEIGDLVVVFLVHPMEQMKWAARQDAIVAAILAFGFLGVLQALVARSVTRPLARITDVIEGVAKGKLKAQLPNMSRSDEVGRLSRALEVFQENATNLLKVQAEAEINRRIAKLAVIDDLTGLSNRRALEEYFSEIDGRSNPSSKEYYALVHIDLDGFKQINDTLGHQAGDHVIQTTAERLKEFEPGCDMIARVGGDEFLLVLRQSPSSTAANDLASRVVTSLSEPIDLDGQLIRLSASAGVALNCLGQESMSVTLANADIALYRAKAAGKGVAIEFDQSHRQQVYEKKKLSDAILNGLEVGDFVPFYQPIVDARTHELCSIELLARWQHPVEGVLPPARFLDVATDLNLMRHIDRQVLSSALNTLDDLNRGGYRLPRLSLNVSLTRLIEPEFIDMLATASKQNIDLDVELLESTYLDELSDEVFWHLDQIRELGVGLHIDDFGTGHSSIAGLLKIGPDKLKIDRQFVMPSLKDTRSRELVKIIIGIADLLGIKVVAEGVETLEHAKLMAELGVDFLQGYFFARPQPFARLHQSLEFSLPAQSYRGSRVI